MDVSGRGTWIQRKQIPIDLDIIRAYIEQTGLLLDQTSNYITYFRRYNILAALNCPTQQSKEMLREEADLLQQDDRNLFGKSLANTWWFQLNKKNRPLKYLLKRARKNKSPFGMALQKHRGVVMRGSIRNSSSTKDMGNRGKKYSTETTAQKLVEAVDSKVKINTKETFFIMLFSPIIPMEDLRNVHPWVKSLFSARKVPNLPLAGTLKHFLEVWEILTKDPEIL